MTRPSDKKRKAQASEQTLEDGLGATQHSRLPLGRSDASSGSLEDRPYTQKTATKRQKTTGSVSPGRGLIAPSSTDGLVNTPAVEEGDMVMEDSSEQQPGSLPKEPRAKRTNAKKQDLQEAEEEDDMKVQERLRAKATVFNPVPHPAFAPWHGDFAAPTPPYENQQACPIDWSRVTIIHDDPLHCQEAYELRRPWDKEAVAWDGVAEKVFFPPAEDGTVRHISPEGVRKRFKAANRAVFELTGVYFPESSLGLEGHGIPLYK